MSVSANGGASLTYQPFPYLYYRINGPFVPAHNMMFFGEINRNSDTGLQYAGDTLHTMGRDTVKERMGPPLYYQSQTLPRSLHGQKKSPYWVSKRTFRGSQAHCMSPAPSECESDDSGRSSSTSTSTTTHEAKAIRCQYELEPWRMSHYQYPRFPNASECGPPLQHQTVFFHNKRRYDGSRASTRGHRPSPLNQHFQQSFHIAPDRYLMKSHLIQAKDTPKNLLTGSKWDTLSLEIWNKFMLCQQTEETFRNKMTLWRFLYISIKNMFPKYSLYLVGSTASGFGSDISDMDLCLLVRSQEAMDNRAQALAHLDTILKFIKTMDVFVHADLIKAKVPILKFRDNCFSLEVDLNCNNVVGIRNTHLLYCYSQLDWRVRPLVLIIKLWAQYNDINDPKNKTVSSYSLVLMVLHYLQLGVSPPVLPCLQSEFPDKFDANQDIHHIDMFDHMPTYSSKNEQTLGELLFGFLKYYTNFDYTQNTISVRTGSCLSVENCRASRRNEPHQWKLLCVEEPFDLSNTARSVYDADVFSHVLKVFEKTTRALDTCPSITSLLPP